MLDVTVKTLDGQNKSFSVPEETTVAQFKEKIASCINIPSDTQRLIFHGRVLQDEKLLNEYDVHGKVIHVVQRPPPSLLPSGSDSTSAGPPQGSHNHHHHHVHHLGPNVQSFVVGSFTIPPNIVSNPPQVDGGALNMHINLSPFDVTVSSANSSASDASTTATSTQGTSVTGPSRAGGGRGTSNSMMEAAQRLAQAQRNLALAENAVGRLQNPRTRPDDASATDPNAPNTQVSSATATPSASASNTQRSSATGTTAREARPPELAAILRQAERLHQNLSPFITQLCELAEADPVVEQRDLNNRQRLVDQVSEALHALSHSYHNISDIAYELAAPPPRYLFAQALPLYQQPHVPAVVINQSMSHAAPQSHASAQPQRSGTEQNNSRNNNNAATTISTATTPSSTSSSQASLSSTAPSAPISTPSLSLPSVQGQGPDAAQHTHTSSQSQSSSSSASVSVSEGAVGAGGSDPYVFVEVGPDSLTVNSISTTVVMSEEVDEDMDAENSHQGEEMAAPSSSTTPADTSTTTTASQPAQSATSTTTSAGGFVGGMPPVSFQGLSGIPGIPSDVMNSIVQSVLQAHGVRQGDQVQVNVVPVQVPGGGPGMIGVHANSSFLVPGSAPVTTSAGTNSTSSASQSGTSVTTTTTGTTSPATGAAPTSAATSATVPASSSSSSQPAQRPQQPMRPASRLSASAPEFVPRAPGANGGPGNVFARIPIFRQRAPVFPPGPGMLPMPLMQPTDIYLPCFSHHFISQAVREQLDQRMQNMPGPHNLGNMMAGMMSNLFGQPRARAPPVSERSSQQPGGTPQRNANDSTARAQTSTTATQQGSISANPFATLFSQILGGAGPLGQMAAANAASAAANTPGGESGSSSGSTWESSSEAPADHYFARLIQGVHASQAGSGSNQSGQTVAAFLQTLGNNHSIVPGEGFVTDAFLCVADHLTFGDIINMFAGQHQPVGRLRRPLRQFVSQRVLGGSSVTDDNLQRATERLVDREILPDITSLVAGAEVRTNVNLNATLRKFFSHHLMALFKLIVDFDVNDDEFALRFFTEFRRMLGEFVVLMPACLQGGQHAFTSVIQNRLMSMLTGLNPMAQQFLTSITMQNVASFQYSQDLTPAQVDHYIVRSSSTSSTTTAKVATTPSSSSTKTHASSSTPSSATATPSRKGEGEAQVGKVSSSSSPGQRSLSPMEVDSQAGDSSPSATCRPGANTAQAPRSLDLPRRSDRVETRSRTQATSQVVNGNHSPAASSPAATATSPNNRQENWHDVVPSEWVPVMEADVQRQKSQRPQAPFSDAYLQGMPPKRRRLMSYEHAGNLSNMSDYLPTAVKQAAGRAGVEPISSIDNLAAEATDAQELQGLLEAELTQSLSHRLEQDHDYSAERFPSAHKYFKPKPS